MRAMAKRGFYLRPITLIQGPVLIQLKQGAGSRTTSRAPSSGNKRGAIGLGEDVDNRDVDNASEEEEAEKESRLMPRLDW